MIKKGSTTIPVQASIKTCNYRDCANGVVSEGSQTFEDTQQYTTTKAPTQLEASVEAASGTFRLPRETVGTSVKVSNVGTADAWVQLEGADGVGAGQEVGLVGVGKTASHDLGGVTITGADVTRGYVESEPVVAADMGSAESTKGTGSVRLELDAPLKTSVSNDMPEKVQAGDTFDFFVEIANDVDVDMTDVQLLVDGEAVSDETTTIPAGEATVATASFKVEAADIKAGEIRADFSVTARPDFGDEQVAGRAATARVNGGADLARTAADVFTLPVEQVVVPVKAKDAPGNNPSGASTSKSSVPKTGAQIAGIGAMSAVVIALGVGLARKGRQSIDESAA